MTITYDESVERRASLKKAAAPAIAVLTSVAIAAPIFAIAMPPVMDYPNHLTRIWLLAGGAQVPPLSHIYDVRWNQATTNILIDLVATGLSRVLSVMLVGKLLLLALFLGPPLAASALNRRLFGHLDAWQLAGVALVWSTTAVTGLISYQIGLAAALACATTLTSAAGTTKPMRLGLVGLCSAALVLLHPFAALFFLILMAALTLGEKIPRPLSPEWLKQCTARILLLNATCAVPVVLLFLAPPQLPGANGTHHGFMYWEPLRETLSPKNVALIELSPFLSYKTSIDCALALPLFATVVWAAIHKRLSVHAGLTITGVALLIISPFLPMNFGDGGAFPTRFPMMAVLMLFAGTRPSFATRRENALLAGVLLTTAVLRIGTISTIWLERANDIEDLRTVTAPLPAGASVMVLQQKWNEARPLPYGRLLAGFPGGRCASERHFASLAVMWRHVFIPTLFTVPGQQPLAVKTPWKRVAVYSSGIPFVEDMHTPIAQELDPYIVGWRKKFDFVLLLDADFGTPNLPGVRLVADRGFARLYRVVR